MSVDVVSSAHPDYDHYRDTDSMRGAPSEVLLPSSPIEVAACLQRAAARGGPVSVRSGGHGTFRPATNDGGTVIDLRRMRGVEFDDASGSDPRGGTVLVGAGVPLGRLAAVLGERGLAVSTGDAGDVGVGGTVLAGGIGLLGRSAGLFVDRVEGLETVNAEGTVTSLSRERHPDRFAAALGGATAEVITAVRMRPLPLGAVRHTVLLQHPVDPAGWIEGWAAALASAPRALTAFAYLFAADGRLNAQTTAVVADPDGASDARSDAPHADALHADALHADALHADAQLADTLLADVDELGEARIREARTVPYAQLVPCTGAPRLAEHTDHARTALVPAVDSRTARKLAALLASGTATKLELRALGGAYDDAAAGSRAVQLADATLLVRALGPDARRLDAAWRPISRRSLGAYPGLESPSDAVRMPHGYLAS